MKKLCLIFSLCVLGYMSKAQSCGEETFHASFNDGNAHLVLRNMPSVTISGDFVCRNLSMHIFDHDQDGKADSVSLHILEQRPGKHSLSCIFTVSRNYEISLHCNCGYSGQAQNDIWTAYQILTEYLSEKQKRKIPGLPL